ncbi:MAG: JAB domain-containing protein [Bacteroidetes bacterium]|nr:JAB domain-containing protein [Bacteroidota bacterium]
MSISINPSKTLCEIKVAYSSKVKVSERIKITSSTCAAELLRSIWSEDLEIREEFNILLLNRANHVLGWFNVSVGGTSATVIDPKLIFSVALKCNASGVILAHNHPSGNLKPSEADLNLTTKLKEGGKILEIQILDHIILTSESYYSFADEGIM